ncbi:MAG: gamma-glutamyl-gamma-aminobutyrate hydrolase family protein [Actinomycetota bacterium]
MSALVLIVGRLAAETKGVRGEPFAAGQRYFRAVARAGGTPLMLPPIPELVDEVPALISRVDAVVLHGGGDIDPRHYGQEPSAEQLYGIVREHDAVELAVVRAALDADVPTLAICRGMQVLNVAMGGTLVQDIGNESHWMSYSHDVVLDADSLVAAAIGTTHPKACHCVHHQALDTVASGLHITGRTADGLVHAAEVSDARWIVAVQWHPEDSAAADSEQQHLFDALLAHT